jgi:hypothetical protein
VFASGEQLAGGTFGEGLDAHLDEHLMRGPTLLAGVEAPPLTT